MTDALGGDTAEADLGSRTSRLVAHALTWLLAADILGAAARLAVPPLLSSSQSAFDVAMHVKPIVILSRIAFAATVVVFLYWFYDARIKAEQSDWKQRRARPWAFWGWIIPVADFWIPFQVMGDIWRAYQPPQRRRKTAWLPVIWWTSFLLASLFSGHHAQRAGGTTDYGLQLAQSWDTFALFAIAGLSLIAIIQTVSIRSGIASVGGSATPDRSTSPELPSASCQAQVRRAV